jgi:hypothetical protein
MSVALGSRESFELAAARTSRFLGVRLGGAGNKKQHRRGLTLGELVAREILTQTPLLEGVME